MSSVASDPTIFAPAKAQNPGRSGAAPDRSGNNREFAKLLDDEPAREPVSRSKRNEAKAPRRDDTAPARDASRSDGSAEPASSDRSASPTTDTAERTPATDDAAKDATKSAADTDAGTQPANETAETEATGLSAMPLALPVVEAPAVTAPTVIAAAPAPANPLTPETAPAPASPHGDIVPAAAPPVATPAAGASAGAAEGAAPGGSTAAVAPVAPGAMKAQQQAATNIETSEPKTPDVAQAKPATASALTETPARAEPEAGPPVRPAPQRAATPGEAATDATARPSDSAAIAKTGAELAQSLGITAPAQHAAPAQSTAAAHAAAAAAPAQAPAVPVANVAFEIAAQSLAGKNRFEIRLDPPELGRIDVRLEIDNEGHVKSRLIVERAETLDMLRRDAPQLERALQQAGLKTSDNALEFSLRDQTQHRDNDDNGNGRRVGIADDTLPATDTVQHNYGRLLGLGGGLDIRV